MSRPTNEDGRLDQDPQTSGSQGAEDCANVGSDAVAEDALLSGLGSGLTPEQWDAFLTEDEEVPASPPRKKDPKRASTQ